MRLRVGEKDRMCKMDGKNERVREEDMDKTRENEGEIDLIQRWRKQ